MVALVLACKQIWGHVQTCATAVKMADLKYYSLSSSFSTFLFSFFFFAVCRTRHKVKYFQIKFINNFSRNLRVIKVKSNQYEYLRTLMSSAIIGLFELLNPGCPPRDETRHY